MGVVHAPLLLVLLAQQPPDTAALWPSYGRDPGGARYSPLTDINRANVQRLRVAWTYHTGDVAVEEHGRRGSSFETTPLFVDGTLYLDTPFGRVIALDPVHGTPRWTYDPKIDVKAGYGDFTSRGVATWVDPVRKRGDPCRRRIFVATIDARLIALDAADGRPCADFGAAGSVDLRVGVRNGIAEPAEYEETSPPAVIGDVVVVGSGIADNNRADAPSGAVRAFDARTGALLWSWDPVPQDSTDPAWQTWRGPKAHDTGAANAWSVITADSARDLLFVPTGSASPDYYGGERLGANLYANSVVALRASTGKPVWHFQVVHHDLWDYDVPAAPALVVVARRGSRCFRWRSAPSRRATSRARKRRPPSRSRCCPSRSSRSASRRRRRSACRTRRARGAARRSPACGRTVRSRRPACAGRWSCRGTSAG